VTGATDRPDDSRGPSAALPTIADVLRLEVVTAAAPEVVAGFDGLQRPVRWVHVTETASVAGFVRGGELLLSTGVGWPREPGALTGYARELEQAGVAGLVLELGRHVSSPPPELVDACAAHDMPLIVLHRQARFIAVTEAVHGRIIADQMNALRARDEVHELFTDLSLRGSPADFIVEQIGDALGAPVVLEDVAHHVISAETQGSDADVLADWEQRSRAAHRASHAETGAGNGSAAYRAADDEANRPARRAVDAGAENGSGAPGGPDDWLIVPVEARGTRWGHLVALPGRAHPAGRMNVLEQGAVALALSRLADRDAHEWIRRSQQNLLDTVLQGRFRSERGLQARCEASGFPIVGRTLFGLAIRGRVAPPSPELIRRVADDLALDLLAGAPSGVASTHILVALSLPAGLGARDTHLDAFAALLAERSDGAEATVAVGSEAHDIPGLLSSLDEAGELLGRGGGRGRGLTMQRAENRPLLRLVTSLAGDPRLQAHSERMLAPMIEHDLASGGDLLDVLEAYAAHPGNRTRAAAASHLSRSVFYQRIAQIERLLDVDLEDGETVSALHTALLAVRRPSG
jgi:purine catabolism regulator